MRSRRIKIDLRLNEKEFQKLNEDVAKTGWSREKYLRALISNAPIKTKPSLDLICVLRNLQQINNNMNQIAIKAHSMGLVDATSYRQNVEMLTGVIGELLEVMYG